MQQELQHPVRVHRLPQQRQGELQYLGGRPKTRVVLEAAPGQSGALKRIVQHDSIDLGEQECPANPPGFQKEFGDRVRGEILRGGLHHDERAVAPEGFALRCAVIIAIGHGQEASLHARQVRTVGSGGREFEPGRRGPG